MKIMDEKTCQKQCRNIVLATYTILRPEYGSDLCKKRMRLKIDNPISDSRIQLYSGNNCRVKLIQSLPIGSWTIRYKYDCLYAPYVLGREMGFEYDLESGPDLLIIHGGQNCFEQALYSAAFFRNKKSSNNYRTQTEVATCKCEEAEKTQLAQKQDLPLTWVGCHGEKDLEKIMTELLNQ
jgi:hypothetical protein